jgi:hypothetical protein
MKREVGGIVVWCDDQDRCFPLEKPREPVR